MENFSLNFLWFEKNIAVSLDQRIGDKIIPLTGYFFWPDEDAWEKIKIFSEKENWISSENSFIFLNQMTEVINCWEVSNQGVFNTNDLIKIFEKFPNCLFLACD
jgi:30S ribosomal protein 3